MIYDDNDGDSDNDEDNGYHDGSVLIMIESRYYYRTSGVWRSSISIHWSSIMGYPSHISDTFIYHISYPYDPRSFQSHIPSHHP